MNRVAEIRRPPIPCRHRSNIGEFQMTGIRFIALDTQTVCALQSGGRDAYGNMPEKCVSDGGAIPCRHCFRPVAEGETYLVLAHRPFASEQPYAETGPIFLHAKECNRAPESRSLPSMFHFGGSYILRGYRQDDWINYKVAEVVEARRTDDIAASMLSQDNVAYLHMRSSRFNCYQARIERA
jgi:Protein of unknown function (DUF1203)